MDTNTLTRSLSLDWKAAKKLCERGWKIPQAHSQQQQQMTTILHDLGMGSGLGSLAPRWGLRSRPLLCTIKSKTVNSEAPVCSIQDFLVQLQQGHPHTIPPTHSTHNTPWGNSARIFLLEGGTDNHHSTVQAKAGFCKREGGGETAQDCTPISPSCSAQEQNSEQAHFEQGMATEPKSRDPFASNCY